MKILLKDITRVRAGHPFRGAIEENSKGNGFVVQVKQIDVDGKIDWDSRIQAEVHSRKEPGWLKAGDVLFISRGPKLVAAAVIDPPEHTVCSPHFFVLTDIRSDLLPEFLAWQLNQNMAQRYFQKAAMGSAQLSVNKTALESLPLAIPSIEQQQNIVALASCIKKEKELFSLLINNRKQQLAAVAQNIL